MHIFEYRRNKQRLAGAWTVLHSLRLLPGKTIQDRTFWHILLLCGLCTLAVEHLHLQTGSLLLESKLAALFFVRCLRVFVDDDFLVHVVHTLVTFEEVVTPEAFDLVHLVLLGVLLPEQQACFGDETFSCCAAIITTFLRHVLLEHLANLLSFSLEVVHQDVYRGVLGTCLSNL